MDANPFLAQFMKQQAQKMPELKKVTPTSSATPTHTNTIREFAKSKPTGKDVEKWFKAKIESLEAEED